MLVREYSTPAAAIVGVRRSLKKLFHGDYDFIKKFIDICQYESMGIKIHDLLDDELIDRIVMSHDKHPSQFLPMEIYIALLQKKPELSRKWGDLFLRYVEPTRPLAFESAIYYAAIAKRYDCIAKLTVSLCRLTRANPLFIFEVVKNGCVETLKIILASSDNPRQIANLAEASGLTLLHEASIAMKPKVIDALLAAGANIEAADTLGETALHKVAKHGDPKVLSQLIAARANIAASNHRGLTALHLAITHSIIHGFEAVNLLLGAGADVNATDESGETALHKVARIKSNKLPRDIFEVTDRREWFALVAYDRGGQARDMAKSLLAHGADIKRVCREHRTAMHLAVIGENHFVAAFLASFCIMDRSIFDIVDIRGGHPFHHLAFVLNLINESIFFPEDFLADTHTSAEVKTLLLNFQKLYSGVKSDNAVAVADAIRDDPRILSVYTKGYTILQYAYFKDSSSILIDVITQYLRFCPAITRSFIEKAELSKTTLSNRLTTIIRGGGSISAEEVHTIEKMQASTNIALHILRGIESSREIVR